MNAKDIHEPYAVAVCVISMGLKRFKKGLWMGYMSAFYAAMTREGVETIFVCLLFQTGNELYMGEELEEAPVKLTREVVTSKMGDESVGKGCYMVFN